MNDANNALAPCPFCKSRCVTATRDEHGWKIVECDDCGARGPCIDLDGDQYIDRWNALSTPNAPVEPAGLRSLRHLLGHMPDKDLHLRRFDAQQLLQFIDAILAVRLDEAHAKALSEAEALATQLSDALLKVRPLGGSELFINRNGKYYADPKYCGDAIEERIVAYHEAMKESVRERKRALAAESLLAEAMRVIELFAQEADPWIKWRDEFKVDQHELNRNHARVPVPAVLAARAFTEAANSKQEKNNAE